MQMYIQHRITKYKNQKILELEREIHNYGWKFPLTNRTTIQKINKHKRNK